MVVIDVRPYKLFKLFNSIYIYNGLGMHLVPTPGSHLH